MRDNKTKAFLVTKPRLRNEIRGDILKSNSDTAIRNALEIINLGMRRLNSEIKSFKVRHHHIVGINRFFGKSQNFADCVPNIVISFTARQCNIFSLSTILRTYPLSTPDTNPEKPLIFESGFRYSFHCSRFSAE
ncbi:MAG: hypothetical protein BWK80_18400 [Desulfobacteraceae bacterium IS3]|nr:MAG: hypothetical protein BWK80_18400 [Desulfobacteraceae bacterium IS3]